MNVKTDTKEKFHVISVLEPALTATMTEEMAFCLMPFLQNEVKNIVLNLKDTAKMDAAAAEQLVDIQQKFYGEKASFVLCNLQPEVRDKLSEIDLLEQLNITNTESEAWDIVQMEELEREFLSEEGL